MTQLAAGVPDANHLFSPLPHLNLNVFLLYYQKNGDEIFLKAKNPSVN